MKENVLDVLVYLFENYFVDDGGPDHDQDSLNVELLQAGFSQGEINKAFSWLEGLSDLQAGAQIGRLASQSVRIFTPQEMDRLDVDCRGLLLFLEQLGVLDHELRELVIDRVMALEADDVDLDTVKWVILMVLFNQPGQEAAYAWMEDFIFDELVHALH